MKMKKYLLVFMMMFAMLFSTSSTCNAQTYYYKTYQFAMKYKVGNTWTDWSDWEKSDILVSINLDTDIITVFSAQKQIYRVLENMGSYRDESGGKQTKFYVIDQDDDLGYVRLRIERDGGSQIYVDFNDIMWVYSVKRI